jgi:hypothetical protein
MLSLAVSFFSAICHAGVVATMDLSVNMYVFSVPQDPTQNQDQDLDQDGIADWWEIQSFGSTDVVSGNSDFDQDGFMDLDEYKAGTDPNDPHSLFVVGPLQFGPDGSVIVTWDSSTSTIPAPRVYEVFCADTVQDLLNDNYIVMQRNIRSAGKSTTLTVSAPASNNQFFGVRVRMDLP